MTMPQLPDGWRPDPGDYSRWTPVRAWGSLEDFLDGAALDNGTDVIRLPSGDHLDVLFGGEDGPTGQCVPAFFTGAMPARAERTPPFFSGVNLGRLAGGRYVAFSDPLVAASTDVSLGWYAGRAGDRVQEAVAAVLELVHHRLGRELLLVGGSGGGFAALEQLRRARVPTSAFVWNPQTDILRYLPQVVDTYLSTALGISRAALSRLPDDQRVSRASAVGISLTAVGRNVSAVADGGRALVLQNASDWHVADHMGPYLDAADLDDRGAGLWGKDRETWLVSTMGRGHAVPPRATLEAGYRQMLREGADPEQIAHDLRRRGHAPVTPPAELPVDLRGMAPSLARSGIRAIRDACGLVRVWLANPEALPDAVGAKVELHQAGHTIRRDLTGQGITVLGPGVTGATVVLRDRFGHEVDRQTVPVALVPDGPGVAVVGSCVSRDAVPHMSVPMTLVDYEARQSLISAFSGAVPLPAEHVDLASSFQRRMFEADHASTLPDRVRELAPATDLLVWDLVDERLGVFIHGDGRVTTDTVEWRSLNPGQQAPVGSRHVPFGSAEHLMLFRQALVRWRELLDATGLRARTVLLAPPWADRATGGQPTDPSFGVSAPAANAATAAYVAAVQELVGIKVVGRDLDTRAGEDHRWGNAPFHFDDATERSIADLIVAQLPSGQTLGGTIVGPSGVAVSTGPGGPGAVVVGATPPPGSKVAFHLFRGSERIATTPYGTATGHTFWRLTSGRYLVRVFVMLPDGSRVSQASPGVVLS